MTRKRKVPVDLSMIRERVDTLGALQKGDVVRLTGEQGSFTFLSAVVEGEACLWVDLHGGLPNREMLRSVYCSRLKVPGPRVLRRQRAARMAS